MSVLVSSSWSVLLFAILTMVATRVLDMGLKERIPPTALKYISTGLGIMSQTTAALLMGLPWKQSLVMGILAGLGGVGSWSAIGKYMPGLRKKGES